MVPPNIFYKSMTTANFNEADYPSMTDDDIDYELACLQKEHNKCQKILDDLETEMIGLKEEKRKRQEEKRPFKLNEEI